MTSSRASRGCCLVTNKRLCSPTRLQSSGMQNVRRSVSKSTCFSKKQDLIEGFKQNMKNLTKNNINPFWGSIPAPTVHLQGWILPYYEKMTMLLKKTVGSKNKLGRLRKVSSQPGSLYQQFLDQKLPRWRKDGPPKIANEENNFEQVMMATSQSIASFHSNLNKDCSDLTLSDKRDTQEEAVDTSFKLLNWVKYQKYDVVSKAREKKLFVQRDFVSKMDIEKRTKSLVHSLRAANTESSKLKRMEDLCNHLTKYSSSRSVAYKEKVLPVLLKLLRARDMNIKAQARQALALIGYVPSPRGRGIRLLTIDGGGTRGLVAIEILKKLEEACRTDISELFDYVCGVSTGALILSLKFLYRISIEECEQAYKEFSARMFSTNKLLGTGKLVWNHAFYDSQVWEEILKYNVGEKTMIEFAKDPLCPKMSVVSCIMNVPKMKNYLFHNYNYPPGVYSRHLGTCNYKLWETIRASSAAPGYYKEFVLDDFVHQDGGLLTNNPTSLAIHECRLLWPNTPLQCVVSLGNGRYEPNMECFPRDISLKVKFEQLISSATDTEAVHATLSDLLPTASYFRFNPYMSEDISLDEIRPEKIDKLQHETVMYLRKNDFKIQQAANQLLRERHIHQKMSDWLTLKKNLWL